jgi:hypothetical protein
MEEIPEISDKNFDEKQISEISDKNFDEKQNSDKHPDWESDEEEFEVINEDDFGIKKLSPNVEKELIHLLEQVLIHKAGKKLCF